MNFSSPLNILSCFEKIHNLRMNLEKIELISFIDGFEKIGLVLDKVQSHNEKKFFLRIRKSVKKPLKGKKKNALYFIQFMEPYMKSNHIAVLKESFKRIFYVVLRKNIIKHVDKSLLHVKDNPKSIFMLKGLVKILGFKEKKNELMKFFNKWNYM